MTILFSLFIPSRSPSLQEEVEWQKTRRVGWKINTDRVITCSICVSCSSTLNMTGETEAALHFSETLVATVFGRGAVKVTLLTLVLPGGDSLNNFTLPDEWGEVETCVGWTTPTDSQPSPPVVVIKPWNQQPRTLVRRLQMSNGTPDVKMSRAEASLGKLPRLEMSGWRNTLRSFWSSRTCSLWKVQGTGEPVGQKRWFRLLMKMPLRHLPSEVFWSGPSGPRLRV